MRNSRLTLIAIGLAAVAAPLLSAQQTTINVTTTVYDCNGTCNGTNQLLMRSDDYSGTGFATYTTTSFKGNTGNVQSQIGTEGNWKLYLGSQSVRTLWITPNDPVGLQPPGPLPGYYWQSVLAFSYCFDQNNNKVPFPSLVNGSNHCSLGVDFTYNGLEYRLVMTPNLPGPGPATGLVSVVCNSVSSNQCVDWTIAPNADSANPNVANLYYYTSSRPTGVTWVFVGQYYNTFLIHATNP